MADDDDTGGLAGDKKDSPAQKKQVKNEHILIAVGIVTLVIMVIYMRKSAANSSSGVGTTVAQSPYGYNSYAGSPYEASGFDSLSNDLQSMQSEIAGLTADAGNAASSVYTPPTGEVLAGGGYQQGPGQTSIKDASGATYAPIYNAQQLGALAQAGSPVFFQPQPGVFVQTTPGQNVANLPLFSLQQPAPATAA